MCGGEDATNLGLSNPTDRKIVSDAFTRYLYEGRFSEDDFIGIIFFCWSIEPNHDGIKMTNAYRILDIEKALTSSGLSPSYLTGTEWRRVLEMSNKLA